MEEDNNTTQETAPAKGVLEKFKSVDALAHAYEQLESEFTRRSQRLKSLEEELKTAAPTQEEIFAAASQNEEVRARIIGEYLQTLKGVPLMVGGVGVAAPARKPKTIAEAGDLALGYFRTQK